MTGGASWPLSQSPGCSPGSGPPELGLRSGELTGGVGLLQLFDSYPEFRQGLSLPLDDFLVSRPFALGPQVAEGLLLETGWHRRQLREGPGISLRFPGT